MHRSELLVVAGIFFRKVEEGGYILTPFFMVFLALNFCRTRLIAVVMIR
jgi:hypothetical protein